MSSTVTQCVLVICLDVDNVLVDCTRSTGCLIDVTLSHSGCTMAAAMLNPPSIDALDPGVTSHEGL